MKRSEEFKKFDNAMEQLLSVPHSEIKKKLDQEKEEKKKRRQKKEKHDNRNQDHNTTE